MSNTESKAPLRLNAIVVGSGIGGLAAAYALSEAGHNVTVVEEKPELSSEGAGLICTTNMARVLRRWGLGPQLDKVGVPSIGMNIRRWKDSSLLRTVRFNEGAEHFQMHRAELHGLLRTIALPRITLRLSSKVVAINPDKPAVTFENGEELAGDFIVGADGLRSYVRSVVIGQPDRAEATGDAADREFFSEEDLESDPDLKPLLESGMNLWLGPDAHVVMFAFMAGGKKRLFVSLLHPDKGAVESWTAKGSAEEMREFFAEWDAPVSKIVNLMKEPMRYKLMDRKPLDTWVHSSGKIALLGDACHPMLPYQAQGAAMAIEDGAVLGGIFTHVTNRAQIPTLLRAYESLRYERCTKMQTGSRGNQRLYHLFDGPEQEARDNFMRSIPPGKLDPVLSAQFEYDTDVAVRNWWEEKGEAELAAVVNGA